MRGLLRRAWTAAAAALLLALPAAQAKAQVVHEWYLKVGSWNLLNFGTSKATFPGGADRVNLLTRIGAIAGNYDIIIFQEVLQSGASVTTNLAPYLPPNYVCNWLSAASGRAGRQERYAICAPPNNAWGTIAIAAITDYSTTGAMYRAADTTSQPAANVWMRPPIIGRVTFTPTDPYFPPIIFDIYTIHTKPAYGTSPTARPPGTVAGAPNNSVVHYELRAVEENLAIGANQMLIGDLNADCAFYPPAYRGVDLAGWNWYIGYGQKTTTAVGAACGYDRIILNPSLDGYRRASGVDYPGYGNATQLDGRRISDHYPVWVELYQKSIAPSRKRALSSSPTLPVTSGNQQKKYITADMVNVTGSALAPSKTSALLWITAATAARSYSSNFTYTLADVRGQASPAATDANGDFIQAVTWRNPSAGAYTFVFDVNGDGKYSKADGDFTNADTEADIYVTAGTGAHSDLVTLGDNMVSRDVFSLAQAKNVYLVGQNLPASMTGNAYILSWKLVKAAGYSDWQAARAAGIDLASYAIPIQLAGQGLISTPAIAAADTRQPFSTNPRGELFMSVWSKPAQLMNATVNYRTPPAVDFTPSQAGNGDPPENPDDTGFDDDPCRDAYQSGDSKLKSVCAFGYEFTDYYGSAFNVVLDLDGDGMLSATDPIDVRDIDDMTTYFNGPGATVLGPNANGNPAVSEYKEYLSRALSVDLGSDNIYDPATTAASTRYACGATLSKAAFQKWIAPDAATGFRVLDETTYASERNTDSGLYQFDDAYLNGGTFTDADVCVSADEISYGGAFSATQGSNLSYVADSHRLENTSISVFDSTMCFTAVAAVAATAFVVGVETGVFTAGISSFAMTIAALAILGTGKIACEVAATVGEKTVAGQPLPSATVGK